MLEGEHEWDSCLWVMEAVDLPTENTVVVVVVGLSLFVDDLQR